MNKLDKIITEAINNNVLFRELNAHGANLQGYNARLKQLSGRGNTNSPEISTFISELYNFTTAIIAAIKRCVAKQSLNETNGWGLKDLPILTQPYRDFVYGFNRGNLENIVQKIRGGIIGDDDMQQRNSGRGINTPQNAKLEVLLTQYYPPIHQKYVKLNSKYNYALDNMHPIKYMIQEFEGIITKIRNAQGTP